MKWRLVTEMRFPEPACRVATCLESVGDRSFAQREPERLGSRLRRPGIELMSKSRLITSRHEARPSRAAVWTAHIAAPEPHAVVGDAIDIRRRNLVGESLAPQFTVA